LETARLDREGSVGANKINRLCGDFIALEDPFVRDAGSGGDALERFLVRVAHEQFPWQESVFASLSRTKLIYGEAADQAGQSVITPTYLSDTLGCGLNDFLGVAFFLTAGADVNGGVFDANWLSQPNFDALRRFLPAEAIVGSATRQFVQSLAEFRSSVRSGAFDDRYLRRYEFNPLIARPFVDLGGVTIAPVPSAVFLRASPTGVYFMGVERSGTRFTTALGEAFEKYVEIQLRHSAPSILMCDHEYERGKKAADFVAVYPEAVVIVEAKATPLRLPSKLGLGTLEQDVERAPIKAVSQVSDTADLISSGHPAFAAVPTDRPMVGLVITMDPYYQVDVPALTDARKRASIPVAIGAARDLERLVSLKTANPAGALVGIDDLRAVRVSAIGGEIEKFEYVPNPVLDAAWMTMPFSASI